MLDSIIKDGIAYHIERDRDNKDGDFFVGQKVYTDKHGYGVIQSIDPYDETDNAIKVKFDNEANQRPFYLNGRYTVQDSHVGQFDLRRLICRGDAPRQRNSHPVQIIITTIDNNKAEGKLTAIYESLDGDEREVSAVYRGTLSDMLEKARVIAEGNEEFPIGALVYSKMYGHGRVSEIKQSSPTDRYPVRVVFHQESHLVGKYFTFDGRYWSGARGSQDITLVCKNPDPAQLEALTNPVEETNKKEEWVDGMPVHCDDKGTGNIINIIDGLTANHEGKSIICQWDDGTCSIHNEEGFYLTNGCDEEGKRITPARITPAI